MTGALQDVAVGARRRLPRPTLRRTARVLTIALVGLVGAALGLLLAGSTQADAGPFVLDLSLRPTTDALTTVSVPPLGELALDTHAGPIDLDVEVRELREEAARRIVDDPEQLATLGAEVTADVQGALVRLVIRAALAAVLGATVLGYLVFRVRRRTLLAAGTAFAALLGTAGIGAASYNSRAFAEPRYTGLLANAPTAIGDVRDVVDRVDEYSASLGRLVGNVSQLYAAASGLPTFTPDDDTIRLLHVSDLHLSPTAFDVIRATADQFDVDLVVDTGDSTDFGTAAESTYAGSMSTVGRPYVWVRGNHDSRTTQAAVAAQPGVTVLDSGEVAEVAGLRLLGRGDPRFTPDQQRDDAEDEQQLVGLGEVLRFDAGLGSPDVIAVHEPPTARLLLGSAPLVLAGHAHQRSVETRDGTMLLVQGSTGGAGLRSLEGEEPTPIALSVVYLDPVSRQVLARDDITLGGLGLSSAQIERTVVPVTTPAP